MFPFLFLLLTNSVTSAIKIFNPYQDMNTILFGDLSNIDNGAFELPPNKSSLPPPFSAKYEDPKNITEFETDAEIVYRLKRMLQTNTVITKALLPENLEFDDPYKFLDLNDLNVISRRALAAFKALGPAKTMFDHPYRGDSEETLKYMYINLGVQFVHHARYKVGFAMRWLEKIRHTIAYKVGYCMRKARFYSQMQRNLIGNVAKIMHSENRQFLLEMRALEQVVRLNIDINDIIDYLHEMHKQHKLQLLQPKPKKKYDLYT